jgi:type I restriction enzyme M protein
MEEVLNKINQHYHNRGIEPKTRYTLLKDIFEYYITNGSYDNCYGSPEVIELLKTIDLRSGDTVQAFFMKFGETFLHRSLDQFYTPSTISEFLGSLFAPCNAVLEPAAGSGDLIVNVEAVAYHFYDRSEDAIELAKLNMLLHRIPPSRCTFDIRDTLLERANPTFPLIITNPPFGVKTVEKRKAVLEQYRYGKGRASQQLGLLFLEQSLAALEPDGILAIIIPTGYLTNQSEQFVREDLLKNYKILGVFFLPDGTFKRSGTGVDTSLLIIQNTTVPSDQDYQVFVENITTIGIQTNKKDTPPLYQKNLETGEILLDAEHGKPVLNNSLPEICARFLTFAKGSAQFRSPVTEDSSFVTATRNELLGNAATMNMKLYLREFVEIQRRVRSRGHFTLSTVVTSVKKGKKKVTKGAEYVYLDISEIQRGGYTMTNVLRGWDLPNRASYAVEPNDILLSKLKGTPSFCMISDSSADAQKIIATNGVFRLRIPDEVKRLTVFRYLFTKEFTDQFNAYTGGSIMANIKEADLLNHIVIPELDKNSVAAARKFVGHLQAAHQTFHTLPAI